MSATATEAFPLSWPAGRARTVPEDRREARFRQAFVACYDGLRDELDRLGAEGVVVSSWVPIRRDGLPDLSKARVADPGVAVHFLRDGAPHVIACDTYRQVRHNLRAIAETIRHLRGIERHGAAFLEQAMRGFRALPAPPLALVEGEAVAA